MTGKLGTIAITCIVVLGAAALNAGQEKAPKPVTENPAPRAEAAAIRKASQAFARAFEQGDAKALADLFTAEGEYVDDSGKPLRGRDALAKAYATFFAKRSQLKAEA